MLYEAAVHPFCSPETVHLQENVGLALSLTVRPPHFLLPFLWSRAWLSLPEEMDQQSMVF